ncbi:hypothetical protein BJ956_002380 [Arthrobacter psychrochitiniphilus]|nr:hypothetical protein [Arthrobacter psychrochitiniphilus]
MPKQMVSVWLPRFRRPVANVRNQVSTNLLLPCTEPRRKIITNDSDLQVSGHLTHGTLCPEVEPESAQGHRPIQWHSPFIPLFQPRTTAVHDTP